MPALFAFIIGAAMFKRRVGGVYFAIITQAIAAILTILIVGQQGYTGGINGITDLRTLQGWDIRTDHAKFILYFVEVALLFGCILLAQFVRLTKLGRMLVAMRDQEDRVRFSGYNVANFKIFAFCFRGGVRRDRRRDVHAAGGLHVAVVRRHRALDRNGDLRRGRRPGVALRRGLRHVAGELRQDSLFGNFPATLAVRHGRAVHRGGAGFPNGLAGIWRSRSAAHRPAARVAQTEIRQRLDRQFGRRRRPGGVRREIMLIGHQPKDFLLAVEALTVSFDGFKAVNDLSFYVEENEIRVIIGPNGAGKTTVLDMICGKTGPPPAPSSFTNQELTGMSENEIVQAGVGRKFQTPSIYEDLTVFENLEISYPRGRSVFGALAFRRDAAVRDRVHKVAEMIFLKDCLDTYGAFLSHGQKQWLEIGMLLMQEPELVMLDEPVAGMSVSERGKPPNCSTASARAARCSSSSTTWNSSRTSRTRSPCCTRARSWPKAAWRTSRTTPRSSKSISAMKEAHVDAGHHRSERHLRPEPGITVSTFTVAPTRSSRSWAATAWARPR